MIRRYGPSAVSAAVLVFGLAGHARAGDDASPPRVTVLVKGHATATADSVEVEFTVDGSAEESSEAKKKYRDKLARVLAALKGEDTGAKKKKPKKSDDDEPKKGANKPSTTTPAKPKKHADDDDEDATPKKETKPKKSDDAEDEDAKAPETPSKDGIPVEVTERGLVFGSKAPKEEARQNQIMVFGAGGNTDNKTERLMHFSSKVVATIRGLPKLERPALLGRLAGLLDSATDSGADNGADGAVPTVRFALDDAESLRKAAYKDAMKRAKDRAADLAALSGRNLGKVVAVTEIPAVPAAEPKAREAFNIFSMLANAAGDAAAPTIDLSADVELSVTFTLE